MKVALQLHVLILDSGLFWEQKKSGAYFKNILRLIRGQDVDAELRTAAEADV